MEVKLEKYIVAEISSVKLSTWIFKKWCFDRSVSSHYCFIRHNIRRLSWSAIALPLDPPRSIFQTVRRPFEGKMEIAQPSRMTCRTKNPIHFQKCICTYRTKRSRAFLCRTCRMCTPTWRKICGELSCTALLLMLRGQHSSGWAWEQNLGNLRPYCQESSYWRWHHDSPRSNSKLDWKHRNPDHFHRK